MRLLRSGSIVALLVSLCACGGSSTSALPGSPSAEPSQSQTQSVVLGSQPTSISLPQVSQIAGTLVFPAVATPVTLAIRASAAPPAGVQPYGLRRAKSGTLTVYEYVSIISPVTITLPSIPSIKLIFPATTPLDDKSVFYGISNLDAQGGLISFTTQGPGTVSGRTVAFAPVPGKVVFSAGHRYTFVIYATAQIVQTGRIFVEDFVESIIRTFGPDGTPSTPTITTGLYFPTAIAIDTAGKIYVTNAGNEMVTFAPDGTPTTPVIETGLDNPLGIAVGAAGKIYIANSYSNTVTTFNSDGSPGTPTITAGLNGPDGVALDTAGNIYVTNLAGNVTTYNPDGSRRALTITAGIDTPQGLAIDAAGKIYVVNAGAGSGTITTYALSGSRTNPTIQIEGSTPQSVAVDAAGKIYVGNASGNDIETTYNADGTPGTPAIPFPPRMASGAGGIAVH